MCGNKRLRLQCLAPVVHSFMFFVASHQCGSYFCQPETTKEEAHPQCVYENAQNSAHDAAPAPTAWDFFSRPCRQACSGLRQCSRNRLCARKSHCHFVFSSAGHQNVSLQTDLICLRSSRLQPPPRRLGSRIQFDAENVII